MRKQKEPIRPQAGGPVGEQGEFKKMRTVVFSSEFDYRVLSFLRSDYASVYSKTWKSGGSRVGVFIHEEYVFRTGTNQTLTTVFESVEGQSQSKVTVVGSGGGKGIFGSDWGSEADGEQTIAAKVEDIVTGLKS